MSTHSSLRRQHALMLLDPTLPLPMAAKKSPLRKFDVYVQEALHCSFAPAKASELHVAYDASQTSPG